MSIDGEQEGSLESPRPPEAAAPAVICSAKGCRLPAQFALRWRNPRLHTNDRRKTWTACPEHRDQLAGFLGARGFLLAVEPLTDADRPEPPRSPSSSPARS